MSILLLISSARNETNLEMTITNFASGEVEVLTLRREINCAKSQSSCSCDFDSSRFVELETPRRRSRAWTRHP